MRKLKKVIAAVAAATMTMAMSISAFADQTITFHFQNANNWETVGAWIYEGVSWDTCVTDSFVKCNKADGTVKNLWPGAKCESEGNGWVKASATFSDAATGASMIFNNFVGDVETNATTQEDDVEAIKASGIATTATATKEQTTDIILNKRNAFANGIPSEVWISYDGKKTTISTTAPDGYAAGGTETPTQAAGTETPTQAAGTTPTQAAGTTPTQAAGTTPTQAAGTGTASNTNAPTTGDTVAVSAILLAVTAVVAVVATKKKVNA